MTEKVTKMILKVDLQCSKCYKKVKKVLSKFPQIRDEVYDEKNNTVTIIVVCCSPEKIRDKLCCKADGAIKSIEIVEDKKKDPEKPKPPPAADPPKPKEPEKPKPPPPVVEKPKEPEKPKPPPEKPKEPEKPKPPPEKPKEPEKPKVVVVDVPKPAPAPAPAPAPKAPEPKPMPQPDPCPMPPPMAAYPIGVCCTQCYEGIPGGPCYQGYGGYGGPPPYNPAHGRPVYDSYGGGYYNTREYCVRPCDYFNEENPQGCSIM